MPRSDRSVDRSSAAAFITFAAAAAVWIGIMAIQPKPASLQASSIVMSQDVTVALPRPHWVELANLPF